MRKNMKMALLGLVTGIANGFFGSGGGIVAVPMLKRQGWSRKSARLLAGDNIAVVSDIGCVLLIWREA